MFLTKFTRLCYGVNLQGDTVRTIETDELYVKFCLEDNKENIHRLTIYECVCLCYIIIFI